MGAEVNIINPKVKTAPRTAIERLLRPRSVAIAGVSASPGSLGGIVLDNLERFAFAGDIHLIHPNRPEVRDRPTVPSPATLPFGVDCVVLAVACEHVLAAVRECAANGVGGVIVFAAGFAELGDEGRALQDEIARIASEAEMVVEGPNCLGFVNYVDGVPLTFAVTAPRSLTGAGVAVVSQSGAMASVVRATLHGRDLDVSIAASTGNEALTGLEDFLELMIEDPASRMIAIVAEHLRSPARFLAAADRARSLGKPLVMLHPGRSNAASEAAQTHTGALAGDHALMRVQVRRHGVLLVDTLEELIDVCDLLMRCRQVPRGGVAVIGESGAYKALTLDLAETIGLALPQPEGSAAAALDAIAPGFIVASNPLDLTAQALGDPTLYAQAMTHLLDNPACGSLLVTIILTSLQMAARKMPPVIAAMAAAGEHRAVVFATLGEDLPLPEGLIDEIRAAGVPFFRSPERALRALARFADMVELPPMATMPPPARRLPPGTIPEHAAKDLLEGFGVPIGSRALATTRDEAIAAARAIGGSVAMKIQSSAISHKSDIGGVLLNLGSDEAVGAAWDRMHDSVATHATGVPLDGVLIEAMARPGLELIVGARRDPAWGVAILIGLGGLTAEALGDTRLIAADLPVEQIERELMKLKGAGLLGTFRGRPPRDLRAIAEAVVALGHFLAVHPEVAELDINPLLAFAEGEGVLALDAVVRCR